MRFYGDAVKMPDNPTKGVPGLAGLFKVVIYYDDNPGSITNWRYFETTEENISYDEGLEIERKRLDELRAQYANQSCG